MILPFAVAGVLLLLGGLLWRLWLGEARRAGRAMKGGLGIPALVLVLAGAGYGLVGYNSHTNDWLEQQREYRPLAREILAGQPPSRDASQVPAGVLVRVLQAELSRQPSTVGWYALGSLYDQLGAPAQSEEAARKALALQPDDVSSQLLLARALIEQAEGKLTDPALEQLRRVLARVPDHEGAWMMLAMAADRAGRFGLAEQGWQALLERHPEGATGELLRKGLARAREQKMLQQRFGQIRATVQGEQSLPAGGTLFVFIRKAGSVGQPLAAKRQLVASFPITVELAPGDWLQAFPGADEALILGARYTPAPGAAVDQAAMVAPPVSLDLPQKSPQTLILGGS